MSNVSKEFVIRPEDRAFCVPGAAVALIKQMLSSDMRVSVVISKWVEKKTPPQHRTVFMWDGEAATQLTIMGALTGSSIVWKKEYAHEMIFKRLCMPSIDLPMPDGSVVSRPMGLSDKEATKDIVSEAMEKYQVWAINHGIELTQPDARREWP